MITNDVDVPLFWSEICEYTINKLNQRELLYEDATPFLYLTELVEGVQTSTTVRYVFIDEAQDYSMFQFEFLKKLFPRASMTVLGDFNQAIFTQATELQGEDSPLVELYGSSDTHLITLTRSYRSTYEIVEFTKSLLPNGNEIIPFERRGEKPLLIKLTDREQLVKRISKDVAALQTEGFTSIAIITKTAAEASSAYEALSAEGCSALRLITKLTKIYEQGTQIIPAYLAKGVEFDAVLIYDASSHTYSKESDRKLLYTACTRAMHRLNLYGTSAWTPFLTENESLFTKYDL
jgi:DNA helicase-2/ATP-dependent DNA helicase PcrA